MFSAQGDEKVAVVEKLSATGDRSLIPTFVLAMRWTGSNTHVAKALSELTGEPISHWHEAYQWLQLHPEITPHKTYRPLKLRFLGNTDEQFREFFDGDFGTREKMKIRLEEIVWGGVLFDEIPALNNPKMIGADEAEYVLNSDLVFGISINDDIRAYPLRILGWHEMLNDRVGGTSIALAYCTLCGSGIVYKTQLTESSDPIQFGTSGLLYRSNKLMFDRKTRSLWNQFTGKPVVGPLIDANISLPTLPLTITNWGTWKKNYPSTQVLSDDTGYLRDYGSGVSYQDYFASSELMFPSAVHDESRVKRKEHVFGMRNLGTSRAWPLSAFLNERVINDNIGQQSLVLVGNASTQSVRAYQRHDGERFDLLGNNLLESRVSGQNARR